MSRETTGGVPRDDTNPIDPNGEPNQEREGDDASAAADADDEAFEQFWRSWQPTGGRGKGSKSAARHRFAKLGPKLRERMLTTTRGYLAMCVKEERSTVDCSTWLGSDAAKSWRAWETQFAADGDDTPPRPDFASRPPAEWTATERRLVERQARERPPDLWDPAVLRLLIHERPRGTTVHNALGDVTWPPAGDTPGLRADDDTLLTWWAQRRSAAA